MSRTFKSCFLLAIATCMLLAQPLAAAEAGRGKLVDVAWVGDNLQTPEVLILDASPTQLYMAKHIPGAVSADLMSYGVQEMSIAETEKLYQSWGISSEKKIVIYDQGGGMMATRLFFSLYYHGFPVKDLSILDGGLTKWQEKGFPITKDATPAPKSGSFKIANVNEDGRVRLPEFLTGSGDPANNVLLDALGPDWHFGEVHPFGKGGHIPNSTMLPSSDFYNPDKTFKSPDEIRRMLSYLGVRPDQQIYTYCGGGVAASVPWFALKFIADYPKVKLYKESEMGWVSDERELPYWTYDTPYLMRQADWLQFWGGKMLRMYGGANISVVDVRPAEVFNQGHVPFALNIPADVFRANISKPEKLAELLGPAGITATHEAVVVSGAGLTKDSALAFLMLEKLGQKRVSVLMDSLDKWTQLDYPLTKNVTVVGLPKMPRGDLSIPRTTYPPNFRNGVVIADAKSTRGVYPKVFIASGRDLPTKAQDGKVAHVPYTDLLNADGTPKAAKDIWNTLVKAGVPRYAEIICFSADPGEAAANYYVLRLMGFPDVKVLVI